MPGEIEPADLTARFNALREVLQNEIRASQELLSARIDGMADERKILLDSLRSDQGGLIKQIEGLRELQDAYHNALQRDAEQHAVAEAGQVANLAAAMQLQLDQRFTAMRDGSILLQQEMDRRFQALDTWLDERNQVTTRMFETGRDNALEAVQSALHSAQQAVDKAEIATEKRFASVNEFRQTLTDQATRFSTRNEIAAQLEGLRATGQRNADAIKDIELRFTSRLDTMAGQAGGAAEFRTEQRLSQGAVVSLVVGVLVFLGLIVSTITLIIHH